MSISVVLVDDHNLMLMGLNHLLTNEGIEVLAQADEGEKAIAEMHEAKEE